jgi:predicted component of type VI protein secretion system
MVAALAKQNRDAWAKTHAYTHTVQEHRQLKLSGRTMTPEAANKLAAYGVIPIVDMVLSDEHSAALRESKAVPEN